jgi:hypothetical protein
MTRGPLVLFGGAAQWLRYPLFSVTLARRNCKVALFDHPSSGETLEATRSILIDRAPPIVAASAIDPAREVELATWASHLAADYTLVGVVNMLDVFVRPAAVCASLFGLPNHGLHAAVHANNKFFQRQLLSQRQPRWYLASADLASRPTFTPIVRKPFFGHGGDRIALTGGDGDCMATRLPDDGTCHTDVLCEEFIAGIDVSVEALICDGTCVFDAVTEERDGEAGQEFLEPGYELPPVRVSTEQQEALRRAHRRLMEELRVESGMVHTEYKLVAKGEPYLMEVALRPPGDGLLDLYRLVTGVSFEEAIVDLAIGERPAAPQIARCARQVYFEGPVGGKLLDVTISDQLSGGAPACPPPVFLGDGMLPPPLRGTEHGLVRVLVDLPRHTTLVHPRAAADRCGSVLIAAPTPEELDEMEAEIVDGLQVIAE